MLIRSSPVRAACAALVVFVSACVATQRAPDAANASSSPDSSGGYVGRFNNNDQGHADLCVKLRQPAAALRYVDGSPSGFQLTNDNLVPREGGGAGVPCPSRGMARLDARELVGLADGRTMLFHRGGWGFLGDDPASAVHFGHVLSADVDTVGLMYVKADTLRGLAGHWVAAPLRPWTGKGQQDGNGAACDARSTEASRISVQSIPGDMRYLNSRQTGAIPYAIYGDPSEDLGTPADRSRGVKYTMLSWSWINTRGGGVARALLHDGEAFYVCTDVPPIKLASVAEAETKTVSGWVTAVYGAVRAGNGAWLYGWAVSAHQHGAERPVLHMRR